MTEVLSRPGAIERGLKRFFTGKPCKYGHIAERMISGGCVECNKQRCLSWYRANKDRALARAAVRYSSMRDQDILRRRRRRAKRLDEERATARQWAAAHKEWKREYDRKRYAEKREYFKKKFAANYSLNKEARKAYTKAWRRANPEKRSAHSQMRRARKNNSGGSHTGEQIKALLKAQKCRCAACRISLKSGYHIDHIVALAAGGGNAISNIQLLCPPCNSRKGKRRMEEFMRERGLLL